jgi:hypothetical protein
MSAHDDHMVAAGTVQPTLSHTEHPVGGLHNGSGVRDGASAPLRASDEVRADVEISRTVKVLDEVIAALTAGGWMQGPALAAKLQEVRVLVAGDEHVAACLVEATSIASLYDNGAGVYARNVLDAIQRGERAAFADLSPLADNSRDAARWRALVGCDHISMQGWAGCDTEGNRMRDREGVHFGAEFWTHYGDDEGQYPTNPAAVKVITHFADAMLTRKTAGDAE